MGDLLYRVSEKCAIYNHILDLKRQYQDVLKDVPSPKEQFVNGVLNAKATKEEEVVIDKLVPEFSQYSSEEKQLDSIHGVREAEQIPEEIHSDEPTVEEAMVPEETKPEEMFVDEELIVDSLDSLDALIPSFFFDDKEDTTTDLEDDDCLNFELLIPSFFFKEKEDLLAEVNFQTIAVPSNEGSCEKLQSSKEFVSGHNNLKMGKGNVFDRGKVIELLKSGSIFFETADNSYESKLFARWIYDRVHSLGLLVVTQIHLGSFIYEFIIFNTGNWFDQIDRTCTLVRQERKLTITIAARTGIHLVENVVEILNCGDAQTFILVEWLEVSASEHEHNQWLPKTMYVYRSICFMSSGYLLSGFSYFWGSASRAKVEIYVVFNCFLDCQTTCARYYTHSKCVVGSLVVMEM
ncbi:hypothetical protein C5167_010184 [Papaver somniferum]|uniref:Uncharacterized protein n=1 Tax=Papaver somniferum TaxID=3469 RepID=A0A4Y7K2B4_PAPSO|nr:hypothetical protein C5167_010184 [Papaver somniferum]